MEMTYVGGMAGWIYKGEPSRYVGGMAGWVYNGSDRSTAETGNWQAEPLVSGLRERLFMFMAAWASSATLRAWTTRSAVKVAER
jgi:hypothetical protein